MKDTTSRGESKRITIRTDTAFCTFDDGGWIRYTSECVAPRSVLADAPMLTDDDAREIAARGKT